MNFFGIGLPEMTLIFIVALLIFGPKKLPEIGRSVGKAIRSLQDASKEFQDEFKREAAEMERTMKQPMQATLETPEPKALGTQTAQTAEEKTDTASEDETPEVTDSSDKGASAESHPEDSSDKIHEPDHAQVAEDQDPEPLNSATKT